MTVRPIDRPLPGERVLHVDPPLAPFVDAEWRMRSNLYPGRALGEAAFAREQACRDGHLAVRGRLVTPGVVEGLEAGVERGGAYFHVSPGRGVAASGEDVVLHRAIRVRVADVPVYGPKEPSVVGPRPALSLEGRLGDVIEHYVRRSMASILLLQPIRAARGGEPDPTDPCREDPEAYAYDDRTLVDGCRLVLCRWPQAWWSELPTRATPRWRSVLAYTIFEKERLLAPDELAPWEEYGVPIALIGFDARFRPLFADRAAVVRGGGAPLAHTPVVADRGAPRLWQARIQQFAEHAADLGAAWLRDHRADEAFRYAPPVGTLPREAIPVIDQELATSWRFFPDSIAVEIRPAPLEQLDAVIAEHAALDPLDLQAAGAVRLLVPVPEADFEPKLLLTDEQPAPEFQDAIDDALERLSVWLYRRARVRSVAGLLLDALDGQGAERFPAVDPGAVQGEAAASELPRKLKDEARYGTVEAEPPLNPSEHVTAVVDLIDRIKVVVEADVKRAMQAEPGSPGEPDKPLAAKINEIGLEGLITLFEGWIRKADDRVDLLFTRVQADIYRVRQQMLGNTLATRLATSPVLVGIAKGKSAAASQAQITKYFKDAAKRQIRPQTEARTARFVSPELSGAGGARLPGAAALPDAGSLPRANLANLAALPSGAMSDLFGDRPFGQSESIFGAAQLNQVIAELQASPIAEKFESILGQAAIVGNTPIERTISIAERLEISPALETKQYAVSTKVDVLSQLLDLEISPPPLEVPGRAMFEDSTGLKKYERPWLSLSKLKELPSERRQALTDLLGETNPDADESMYFSLSAESLEHAVIVLRAYEGRIEQYRRAVADCRATVATIYERLAEADARLKVIGDEVAEARQDVTVGRALLAEEEARLEIVNARRKAILAERVPFFLFHRLRQADRFVELPTRVVEPGLTPDPLPASLDSAAAAPPELHAVVELFRDAPVRWLRHVGPILQRLDQPELLQRVFQTARLRAVSRVAPRFPAVPATSKLGVAVVRRFQGQQEAVSATRAAAASIDLAAVASLGWQDALRLAASVISLGDLIEGGHGRAEVARRTAEELADITRVATSLHARLSGVPAALRLEWAEALSQYDAPVELRDLAALPRWDRIEPVPRRQMQILVNWLFSRVEPAQPEAVALMNDVVRVAMLLASHAPVGDIISGHLPKPVLLRPGSLVDVTVDIARVRVGMHAHLPRPGGGTIRALVEDLSGTLARVRVLDAPGGDTPLAQATSVKFLEPERLGLSLPQRRLFAR